MQDSTWVAIQASRSREGTGLILPFVILHSVSLAIIAFAGDALADSSTQLALTAALVIGTIWIAMNFDGVISDMGALIKDMSGDLAESHLAGNWRKLPIGMMRGVNVVFPVVLLVAQLTAIY